MRLVGEPRVARDLDQRASAVNLLPGELETAHEQVTVGAGPDHGPELAREVLARQPRHRLQLERMHDASLLGVQELPSPFDGSDIDASGHHRPGAAALCGHQPLRQVDDEAVHARDSSGPRNAASMARDSIAFLDTGSLTNGSGDGLPRRLRTAFKRRNGST